MHEQHWSWIKLYCVCAEVAHSRSDANNSRIEERASLLKEEGGTVVKKNLYPPPASLFAPTQGCKTLCVMQHVKKKKKKIHRRLPPGICKATRLKQRCSEERPPIWRNGAGRTKKRYQPEADPGGFWNDFISGCRGQRLFSTRHT